MNCKIHIYLLNDLYSQELADTQHEGNQSIDNIKYEWEDELSISSDVISITELSDVDYPLAGMNENDEAFQFDIPNMHLFEICSSDAPNVYVGASESIVSSAKFEKTDESYTKT
jgi:hypothetical protein